MPLFIRRLPLVENGVVVEVILTEAFAPDAPFDGARLPCFIDTGFTGEMFGTRMHLSIGGLNPDMHRSPDSARMHASLFAGQSVTLPVRTAEAWLLSNQVEFVGKPLRLNLSKGIAFRDEPPPPLTSGRSPRLLLGMAVILRAGFRLQIDGKRKTCSIWISGSDD